MYSVMNSGHLSFRLLPKVGSFTGLLLNKQATC